MKYIGILGFLLALNWTWSLASGESEVDLSEHTSIQEQIIGLVGESVAESQDQVTQVKFETIWTELLSPGKIRATFTYILTRPDQNGGDKISGFADLIQVDDETWAVENVRSSSADIEFATGTVIHPGSE